MKPALSTWFLNDKEIETALREAFHSLEPHHSSIRKLTFSGIEDGRPVLEVLSKAKIPSSIDVAGGSSRVSLRRVTNPLGCVLFAQD